MAAEMATAVTLPDPKHCHFPIESGRVERHGVAVAEALDDTDRLRADIEAPQAEPAGGEHASPPRWKAASRGVPNTPR